MHRRNWSWSSRSPSTKNWLQSFKLEVFFGNKREQENGASCAISLGYFLVRSASILYLFLEQVRTGEQCIEVQMTSVISDAQNCSRTVSLLLNPRIKLDTILANKKAVYENIDCNTKSLRLEPVHNHKELILSHVYFATSLIQTLEHDQVDKSMEQPNCC